MKELRRFLQLLALSHGSLHKAGRAARVPLAKVLVWYLLLSQSQQKQDLSSHSAKAKTALATLCISSCSLAFDCIMNSSCARGRFVCFVYRGVEEQWE